MQHASPTPGSSRSAVKSLDTRSILGATLDGQELSPTGALHLLGLTREDDLHRLREAADELRKQQTGDTVPFESGCSLYITNLCELSPTLYPYPRQPGDAGSCTLSIDEIDACLERAAYRQTERLYVSGGGFWPFLQIPGLEAPNLLKTYTRLCGYIREKAPQIALTGFSPDEVEFLCIVADRDERYVLEMLIDYGVQTLGGNGIEILHDRVRHLISPKKASVNRWLEITATAHRLGLPVIARIEAGPLETLQQRVSHMRQLRRFQQENPGAFSQIIPQMWTKAPPQAALPVPGLPNCKPTDRLKLSAVLRLFLGEAFPRQTVCWQPKGEAEAQDALQWGANSLGSTDALAYHVFLSGSRPTEEYTASDFHRLITETGRIPQPGPVS